MPITLADATRIAPSDVLVDASDPALDAWRKKTQIEGSSQFARGWETAGLSGQANSLYTQALKAERDGDEVGKQALLQQAQDLDTQAQAWAPTVQNVTDVTGLRSAMDWAGGAMGNLRTSIAPALGGLAGGALGALAGPAGAAAGGFAGASLAGYDMETDEAVAAAMRDPYIRANHTPEEILAASRVKGGINAMLEAAVPAVMGGKILGKGAKAAVGAGWKGAAGAIGKEVATGAAGEFATEGAQSLVGQGTQNYLHDQGVTDNLDWTQALNEGAAGAIAGGGMGIVGGGADVLHNRIGQGVDKVREIKKDPAQFAADTVADLGGKAGSGMAALVSGAENIFDKLTDSNRRKHADLINPNIGDAEVEGFAPQWAAHVLDNQKQFSEEDAAAAAKYIQNVGKPGALSLYRLTIEANHNERKHGDKYDGVSSEIANRTGKSKSSKMRGTLVDDFGEQEGRDRQDDRVVDDFGNVAITPAQVKYGDYPGTEHAKGLSVSSKEQDKVTAADIWRKQGVSEKLLSATTDKTDEKQRQMAISVMGWIERGFKDGDGNVFVPETLVKMHGSKTGAAITSAVETAFAHGIIGHDVAQQLPKVLDMAKEQHAEAKNTFDTVVAALPDYSRKLYGTDDVEQVIMPMLRHVAKHGLSSDKAQAQKQEAALLKIFGTKENIAKAMSKFETPKGRNMLAQENNEDDLRDATTGDIRRQKSSDDNVESDANFESLLTTSNTSSKVIGRNNDNDPFDTQDSKQNDKLTALAGDRSSGRVSRIVGLWTSIKNSAESKEDLYDAETALLVKHAKEFMNPSRLDDMERYGVSMAQAVDEMPVMQRRAILSKIDKRFKLIQSDSMGDSAAPDAIPSGRTTDLRESWGMDNVRSTIAEGGLFLERKRADGSIMKDPFKTSTTKLISHFSKSKEYDLLSGDGVTQTYQMILKSLGALMETEGAHKLATKDEYERLAADPDTSPEDLAEAKKNFDKAAQSGQFSGRVGYKTEVDGPIKWMTFERGGWQKDGTWHNAKFDNLPDEFKLDLTSYLKHAKAQADRTLRSGDKAGERVPLATTLPEMEKAIKDLRDNPTTSEAFADWIDMFVLAAPKLKDGMSEEQRKAAQLERDAKISDFYVKQRSWEDGQDDLFSRLSDTTSPKRGSMVESQGSAGLLNWLLRTVPEGNKLDAKRAASDQTIVSTKDGRQPPGRVVKIPASILEKIAKLRAKNMMGKAKVLEDKWTSTFRDVAQWQINNTEGRGSEDDGISIGDLTSDESSMSMTRAEDPSMDGKRVNSTPYIPTFPQAYRDLLMLKKQEGIELSEREETVLEILRKGAVSWNARFGTATQTVGTIHRDEEGKAKGMWAGAEGAAYGGGRSTNTGAQPVAWRQKGGKLGEDKRNPSGASAEASEPISAPLATAETPERAGSKIDPILEARDWAFGVLRKGVPALMASIESFPKDPKQRVAKLKVLIKGLKSIATMSVENVISDFDRSLTPDQANAIISRAAKAEGMISARSGVGERDGNLGKMVGDGRGVESVVGGESGGRGSETAQGRPVLQGSERGAVSEDSGAGRGAAAGNSGAGAQGKSVAGSKQSRMNAGENNGNERSNETGNGEPEGRGNTDDGRLSGIEGSLAEKHKTAFARRVAKVSEQLRLSKVDVSASFSPKQFPISERIRKVLRPHWKEFESLFNTVDVTPLKLQRFHRFTKYLGAKNDLLPYTQQILDQNRAFSVAAKQYLLSKGFPVEDTEFVMSDGSENMEGYFSHAHDMIATYYSIAGEALSGANDEEKAKLLLTIMHEASHKLDTGRIAELLGGALTSSMNAQFGPGGLYWEEAVASTAKGSEYEGHFLYPLDTAQFPHLNEKNIRGEMLAQLYSVYKFDPEWSKIHTPEFFRLAKEIENADSSAEVEVLISGAPSRERFEELLQFISRSVAGNSATTVAGPDAGGGDSRGVQSNRRPDRGDRVLDRGVSTQDNDTRAQGQNLVNSKPSSQTANSGAGRVVYTEEQKAAARKSITDKLGDSVEVLFTEHFGDNSSGKWTPRATQNLITLALNGDILGTAAHESLHEFFSQLGKAGSVKTQALLTRVATNPVMLRKLERLLDGHPEAIKQIMADPEEAAAFMYQFWNAGVLKLGPETQTLFQKVKAFFAKVLHKVSKEALDEQAAEKLFQAFNDGALADNTTREAVLKAFEVNTEVHNKALDALDKYGREMVRTLGKFGFSAEAMLLATKNKSITRIMRHFNQEAGTGMGAETGKQSYFDGYKQQMGIFMNRLENILTDKVYKAEDLELARKALATETEPTDRVAKQIVARIAKLNEDLFHYVTSRKVVRWDHEKHDWVPVEHRKNYFPRVWNTDAIRDNAEKFREMLIKRHMKELAATAELANQEIIEERKLSIGHESRTQLDSGDPEIVTPEMIADAIITRLVRGGHPDVEETTSSLGMSPAATSVNRRSLSWIDDKLFDEFKSHDMTEIMTSYVSSMVKRAEYTKHFGPGGEYLREEFDRALLEEMGGEALIKRAEVEYADLVKLWEKRRAAAIKLGKKFTTPKPTLRRAGVAIHDVMLREKAGKDIERSDESVAAAQADLNKALKSLDQAGRGIMGMEGTLGADVSNGVRAVNSALMTYQTIRLLPMVLFSSINDVMGIVANGGELSDAWKALVRGMREVRLRWKDEKSDDIRAQRAEAWGTVEAGSFMDSLGQTYGSMYMTGNAKRLSDSFFKWTGMEGWNRAMRIEATAVAERALRGLKRVGFDKTDKAAVARWEALYGQGMETSQIALDADGNLDLNDAKNQAAMMRYVNNAIMTPNAAHRTIWGSDTRLAAFWHLKQFSYTFHRVMLKGAMEQAKLGNFRPAMVLALGYAPVTIAAGAVKEMLIPGDEPPWMKGGLGDYLSYGVSRAGIFGVPGMTWSSVSDDYGVNLLGPSVSQVASVPFDNPVKTGLRALPMGSLLGRMAPATP